MIWTREKLYLAGLFAALLISVVVVLFFNRRPCCSKNPTQRVCFLSVGPKPKLETVSVVEYRPVMKTGIVPADWARIGEFVARKYNDYDAFVIVHGMDGMSYTASALSFMLENLEKPVVVTKKINDSFPWWTNKIRIPEVMVLYKNRLFRAVNYGVCLGKPSKINEKLALTKPENKFNFLSINPRLRIGLLKIYPAIDSRVLQGFKDCHAMVLEISGSKTYLSSDFLRSLNDLSEVGSILIVSTKKHPSLAPICIDGHGQSPEVLMTKLYFLLSNLKNPSKDLIKQLLEKSMRGEG